MFESNFQEGYQNNKIVMNGWFFSLNIQNYLYDTCVLSIWCREFDTDSRIAPIHRHVISILKL